MTDPTNRRAVILGDSWIHGIGPERKNHFGLQTVRALGYDDVLDLSAISRLLPDVLSEDIPRALAHRPAVALVSVGGADSLVFPPWAIQRLVDRIAPPEWHGVEGWHPRVRYARDRWTRWRERAEMGLKALVKMLTVYSTGGRRRMSARRREQAIRTVIQRLVQEQILVIAVGFPRVSHALAPLTGRSLRRTSRMLAAACAEVPGAMYVDVRDVPRYWSHFWPDRIHLSPEGHAAVSKAVVAEARGRGVGVQRHSAAVG